MRTASIIVVSALSASPAAAGPRARASLEISYTPSAARTVGFGLSVDVVAGTKPEDDGLSSTVQTVFEPEFYAGGGARFDLFTDGAAQLILEPIAGSAVLQRSESWCQGFRPNLMADVRPGLAVRTRGGPALTFAGGLEGAPGSIDAAARARLGGALALVADPRREARAQDGRVQDLTLSVGAGPILPNMSCSGVIVGRPLRDEDVIVLPGVSRCASNPLAQEWLEQAQEEHAAVAAFLRLAAELELVGAPSDLVHACQLAARDEAEHAQLCLQRAADHEGESLRLTELRTSIRDFAHRGEALQTLATESWIDGAINEGLAALEALARSADASFLADRIVHDRIAVEEQGHSELGAKIALWCAEELLAAG